MITSPFEDDDRGYLVLVNGKNQHSLWPADIPVPAGWRTAHTEDTRAACVAYVGTHWVDPRPASLVESMKDS
jgi:MbtH protein